MVLDHGYVILEETMGSDLTIVNNARVSFDTESAEMTDRDKGLISFLMKNRHGSPFEASVFRFEIKCPIFVAREWMRHRIGSFNEMSARYTVLDTEGYIPSRDDVREQVGKPGAYKFVRIDDDDKAFATRRAVEDVYRHAYATYSLLLQQGIAKEIARLVLPVGTYTKFKWTVNLRSLLNFLSLRNSEHAQKEIREYAIMIEGMITEELPVTMEAFNEFGRMCP